MSVITSTLPDIEIESGVSISEYVFENADERGDKVAFVSATDGSTLTFNQVVTSYKAMGSYLARNGFTTADVLLIFAPNHMHYASAFHGAVSMGGKVSTANFNYTSRELMHQLHDCGATYIVTLSSKLAVVAAALDEDEDIRAQIKSIILLDDSVPEEGKSFAVKVVPFADVLADDGSEFDPNVLIEYDSAPAALPYSSGTTGLSKGVELTHNNLVANLCQTLDMLTLTPEDVCIAFLPFYHIYGMQLLMNCTLRRGVTTIVMDKFDPGVFLTAIQTHKVTHLHIVPPIVLFLAQHPIVDKFDLSSVHTVISGAAPLGDAMGRKLKQKLNCDVRQGYGMTEMSPVSHLSPAGNVKFGSAGILVANTEARIVNADGEDVKQGEQGELWIRGPQVMSGYWNNLEATAETIDETGFLHTGDVAYMDEEGYFFVVDRIKELIKFKGFQVPPAELESLLLTHESITDAAVVGLPNERAGELPLAFVVLAPNATLTEDEVKAFMVAQGIAEYKQLAGGVRFVDAIPKSASGKILRRVLKAQVVAEQKQHHGI